MSWLKPGCQLLVDIYTPWYWSEAAGREIQFGSACRRYGYESTGCRMLDSWWEAGNPDVVVTQSLRCYTPEELEKLTANTGLIPGNIEPGGAMDYKLNVYLPEVPLEQAMSYTACLRKSTS